MKQDLKCMLGSHKYEIYKEEDITLAGTEKVVGKAIISRCNNCGKIRVQEVSLTTYNY